MSRAGSVTGWIDALKRGDETAAQPLWERYHLRLVGLARRMLRACPRAAADEDDIVQHAFQNFFHGVQAGRFPRLKDRHDLWALLVVLTVRKGIDQRRREQRCARRTVADEELKRIFKLESAGPSSLDQLATHHPTPELAAELVEEFVLLLHRLDDAKLQRVALLKLEGYTNGQIAELLDCTRRTVIRRLDVIRVIWSREGE